MNSSSHKHPDFKDFKDEREKEGRQDFEVVVRGVPDIHLTSQEVTDAIYAMVKTKAEAMPVHPYFDVEINCYTFRVGTEG